MTRAIILALFQQPISSGSTTNRQQHPATGYARSGRPGGTSNRLKRSFPATIATVLLAVTALAARIGSSQTPADVRFMQGMIAHHAQALAMAALVPVRSERDDIRLLARKIDVSQRDEIVLMRRWLE